MTTYKKMSLTELIKHANSNYSEKAIERRVEQKTNEIFDEEKLEEVRKELILEVKQIFGA